MQEAYHRLGWTADEHKIVFYEDDGRIAGRNPIWVQTTLTLVVWIFERVGIITNLGNTKAMMCNPGLIWEKQETSSYKRRAAGEGATFW